MPVISTIAAATARAFGAFKAAAGGAADEFFNYVTLLLHGDGTNGAQNNTFLDSSTNNFTITRNGNTTQGTFSPFSQDDGKWGAYFDGSGDTIATASGNALTMGTDDFTAELWIYPTALGVVSTLLDNNWSSSTYSWQIGLSSGNVVQVYNANGASSNLLVQTTTTISANTWTLISVVKSGTTVTIYLNGISSASGTMNATFGRDDVNYIGSQNGSTNYFTGYISNVRVVKGTALYTSNFTPSTTPLTSVSGTSLLTCQSNRFKDNSTNNFAITVNGNTSIQPFSPFAPSAAYSAATNGGSGYFDGSGDYLSNIGTTSSFNFMHNTTALFTFECWVYVPSVPSVQQYLIDNSNGTSSQIGVGIDIEPGGAISLFISRGVTGVSNVTAYVISTGTVSANQWNHIAVTYDQSLASNNAKFYINGVFAGQGSKTGNTPSSSNASNAMRIGTYGNGSGAFFNGHISNLRITNSIVYTSAFTPPTAPLTAISGTALLTNFTNAGILDNTGRNDLETVGNAQISTSVKKFGTGSLAFDGTGDYLSGATSLSYALSSGDFTLECWVYLNSSKNQGVWDTRTTNASSTGIALYITSGNAWRMVVNNSTFTVGGSITNSSWTHVAVVRSNTTLTVYVGGTSVNSTTLSTNLTDQSLLVGTIRDNPDTTSTFKLDGYIDDLRITKGVARYTSNFTPPTAAFEDQ